MESLNAEINAIHHAYCESTGFDLQLSAFFERQWFEALKEGLTCDCVKLVIKERIRRIKEGVRRPECLLLRNIAGSEGAIADVAQEAAAIRARMRVKVFPRDKANVLRATGRPDEPEQSTMRPVGDVIRAMKEAIG